MLRRRVCECGKNSVSLSGWMMVQLPKRLHFPDGTERIEHESAPFASDLSWKVNNRGADEKGLVDVTLSVGQRASYHWQTIAQSFGGFVRTLELIQAQMSKGENIEQEQEYPRWAETN